MQALQSAGLPDGTEVEAVVIDDELTTEERTELQYRKAHATNHVRTSLQPQAQYKPRTQSARSIVRVEPRPESPRQPLRGEWRITATELWDADALNMAQPAVIRFDDDRLGALAMIATDADLDCRYTMREGKPLVEFTFDGKDDGDPWLGRGWATLESDGTLRGRLFIHHGDDSDFVAERVTAKPRASTGCMNGGRESRASDPSAGSGVHR